MKKLLQDSLTRQAERQPDSVAVVYRQESITWGELERRSNQLARALKLVGCIRGDRVALLLPKSIEALVGIFASLKADCIYVPIDTASPADSVARVLERCDSLCVLARSDTAPQLNSSLHAGFSRNECRVIWMDVGAEVEAGVNVKFTWQDVLRLPETLLDAQNSEMDPACIHFTSGSTGTPKGVVVTHSSVMHFVEWAVRHFGMNPSDRLSGHSPLYFDLSLFDIHGAIAAGARLYLLPPGMGLLPHNLVEYIREVGLTQWFSVPSILTYMARCDAVEPNGFPSLRRLLWCGEKFPTAALIYWMHHLPNVRFVNLYGPTETTVASSCYHVPQCPNDDKVEIPIGAPCEGEQLFVLDEQLRGVGRGAVGELYIAGVGLSPGYWRDPERTEKAFLRNLVSPAVADRIYRTGDLARIGTDGEIYLVGRTDSQIKIDGHHVQLDDIEAAVQAVSGIIQAAIVSIEGTGFEGTAICCAYVHSQDAELPPPVLNKHLAQVLPSYMLPSRWMVLDQMPGDASGKTDRQWLKEQFVHQAQWRGTTPRHRPHTEVPLAEGSAIAKDEPD